MKIAASFAAFALVSGLAAGAYAADAAARVGEVRTFIVDQNDASAPAALHRDGWIEADGSTLQVAQFPELYKAVGRAWTGRRISHDAFSIPDLNRRDPNPFGVLGPGDLVTNGRT